MRERLWKFTTGYVKIKVEGLKLLAFINDATAKGILFRNAVRGSYSRMLAEVSWRDFRRLTALARNRPLRVVVVGRGGLPDIAVRAAKRIAFAAGLAVCLAVLLAANQFVLTVRINGCSTPGLEAKVSAVLESQGIRAGTPKSSVNLHRCESELELEIPEIAFASIRLTGVVATVSVVEAVAPPKLLDKTTPCDIVARRDAVVRKVVALGGQPKVAPGDAVRRGQVLVSGVMTVGEGEGQSTRTVHAAADVMASVWYEGSGSAPLFSAAKHKTGAVVEQSMLEFAGFRVALGAQPQPGFQDCIAEETVIYPLGPGLKGPRIVTTRYFEAESTETENDFEAAKTKAALDALNAVNALVPKDAGILDSRTVYRYENGCIVVKIYVEALENIALEQKIG